MSENKNTLCLHAGGGVVGRDEIECLATPSPTRKKRWYVPVAHRDLLHAVERSIAAGGLRIRDERFALSKGSDRFFGLITLENDDDGGEYATTIGLRNAHDLSCGVKLALGGRVFVCDNLSFLGEEVISTPHTRNVYARLPGLVGNAVSNLIAKRGLIEKRFTAYQQSEVKGDANLHDLVLRSYLAGAVPVTAIPDVLKEFHSPRHPEFAASSNLWRLFNASTQVLKEYTDVERRTQKLHHVFDVEVASRVLAKSEEVRVIDAPSVAV